MNFLVFLFHSMLRMGRNISAKFANLTQVFFSFLQSINVLSHNFYNFQPNVIKDILCTHLIYSSYAKNYGSTITLILEKAYLYLVEPRNLVLTYSLNNKCISIQTTTGPKWQRPFSSANKLRFYVFRLCLYFQRY